MGCIQSLYLAQQAPARMTFISPTNATILLSPVCQPK